MIINISILLYLLITYLVAKASVLVKIGIIINF